MSESKLNLLNVQCDEVQQVCTQLYDAFSKSSAELCADCYEPFCILNINTEINFIGFAEIKRYWEKLIAANIKPLTKEEAQITSYRRDMFSVKTKWELSTGIRLTMNDTWVKQEDESYKLLVQSIVEKP
ncbi:hypothetical protein [Glaciecola petra]|uniref:Nuclear transport factor 2 family protein n=1 Tax=Glaciecola petra TaxID=3075602 RepID=A0ABU2ZRV5_9ALTE|nr:hypothetical protein [Aestuariibacter sp. P117]MDT0595367.1 hypothetical protein [Aestuariibacter sp. P117]